MREPLFEAWPPDSNPTFSCRACGCSVLEWMEACRDEPVISCKSCGTPAGGFGDLRHIANESLSAAFSGLWRRLVDWLCWKP